MSIVQFQRLIATLMLASSPLAMAQDKQYLPMQHPLVVSSEPAVKIREPAPVVQPKQHRVAKQNRKTIRAKSPVLAGAVLLRPYN